MNGGFGGRGVGNNGRTSNRAAKDPTTPKLRAGDSDFAAP